jgi:deazaflavin-dependent oxidoreductase (nitroreductase family)
VADPKPFNARQVKVGGAVIKVMTKMNNAVYKASGGKVWKTFGGAPVCLMTTTGRKSGQPRTVSLICLRQGDDVVVVGSQGGMPTHPAWYLNLVDHPGCEIQIGATTGRYVARVVDSAEKAQLWPKLLEMYSGYDEYQARTERDIPVIVCSPTP